MVTPGDRLGPSLNFRTRPDHLIKDIAFYETCQTEGVTGLPWPVLGQKSQLASQIQDFVLKACASDKVLDSIVERRTEWNLYKLNRRS